MHECFLEHFANLKQLGLMHRHVVNLYFCFTLFVGYLDMALNLINDFYVHCTVNVLQSFLQ